MRSLRYPSSSIKDDIPLTPNHILIGQSGGEFAADDVDDSGYHPRKLWRQVQELVKHVWKRWIKELLSGLNHLVEIILVLLTWLEENWKLDRSWMEIYPVKDSHGQEVKVRINDAELIQLISKLPLKCELNKDS